MMVGRIDPEIGNEIRRAIVDWCDAYEQPGNRGKFTSVTVHINADDGRTKRAIAVFCEFTHGSPDELLLQKDIMALADELKSRYGIILDELHADHYISTFSFLAPDGELSIHET